MTRPEKTYSLSFEQIEDIADAVRELDAAKDFFIANCENIPALVIRAQNAITAALGDDVHLIYGCDDPETRPA